MLLGSKQTPHDKAGLNSPTLEAAATQLTEGSKPAYVWLRSSLIRRLGISERSLHGPLFLHAEDPLFPYAGTAVSESAETGQDLWLV